MSQSGKLKPNLDQQSTKLLNLTVLQRIDPSVQEILFTATHVSLYDFNIENSQWSRKEVEGSLFVVKRNNQPQFQFIVMNRRNADNLVENLVPDFEYELKVPYLLYRNATEDVNGIWFYNSTECEEVANLFSRILHTYIIESSKSTVYSGTREYEVLESEPIIPAVEGPPEPLSFAPAMSATSEDPSSVNMFSAAYGTGFNDSNTENLRQPYPSGFIAPSHAPNVLLPCSSHAQVPIVSSAPTSFRELSDTRNSIDRTNILVKPSSFLPGISLSSSLMMQPISPPLPPSASHHSLNVQRPYGTPILQPLPPPTPPPSLTSVPSAPFVNKDTVREALLSLIQNDQFVDMVCQALLKKHHSEQ